MMSDYQKRQRTDSSLASKPSLFSMLLEAIKSIRQSKKQPALAKKQQVAATQSSAFSGSQASASPQCHRNRFVIKRERYIDDSDGYVSEDEEDEEDYKSGGYHPIAYGDLLSHGRYRVEKKLGWGHFSTVWLATDLR
jgi:hypothetical protein